MLKMPTFLKLNDARKYKMSYFGSLSALEIEILDTAGKGRVYGAAPGTEPEGTMILTIGKTDKVVEKGQEALDRMVRRGWLRFAKMPSGGGYFWMTDGAERLWAVLGR